jgi:hypothetical protein
MKPRPTFSSRLLSAVAGLATLFVGVVTTHAQPFDLQHPAVRAVVAVQNDVTPGLMNTPAVLGTAVGLDESSHAVLVVYVDREHGSAGATIRSLPVQIRGTVVRIEPTDKFRAMAGKPVSHTAKQTVPIQLGTSGGWRNDLANGYCCGGTLGSLVTDGTNSYILSNYHVLEADIFPGSNGVATTGQFVIQPGLIDVNCTAAKAQDVATLVVRKALPDYNVDCAIAKVLTGKVRSDGAILEIGTISSATVSAFVGQAVKKSGRTTGLTRSAVSGLNASINITYENECAGSQAFTKTFTGQIVITNNGSRFLNSGDSGSLMVEDVTSNPRPVGLLYAGSSFTAIANPVDDVLTFLGPNFKFVGN